MKTLRNVLLALSSFCVVVLIIYFVYIFNHGELADSAPASTLQKIEYENRGRDLGMIAVVATGEGERVLGVRTLNAKVPYAWLYLNRLSSEDRVMITPADAQFAVACSTIQKKLIAETVNGAVAGFLKDKCRH